MASKAKLKFKDGTEIVHFIGVSQGDISLCAHDLAGDSDKWATGGGYDTAVPTTEKVTCDDCKSIVYYGKSVKKSEMSVG